MQWNQKQSILEGVMTAWIPQKSRDSIKSTGVRAVLVDS